MRDKSAASLDLFIVSALLLFLEFVLIRWITASISITAYYSNIILISCFLGFGLGCMLSSRRDFSRWAAAVLVLLILVCRLYDGATIASPFGADYIFSSKGPTHGFFIVPAVYAGVACLFTCIGQRLGAEMNGLAPLRGYTVNIAGSLFGTALFGLFSFWQTTPTAWFIVVFLALALLARRHRRALAATGLLAVLSVVVVHAQQKTSLWSPYYKIRLSAIPPAGSGSFGVEVNNDYHQYGLNLSRQWTSRDPWLRDWGRIYDFPYEISGKTAPEVLVLGAGTGNDVAAALRHDAARVDAVELDPLIYDIGLRRHPERPYADARVHVFLNDARFFLKNPGRRYDMVVIGWLDSHRLFSSLSNVRQDNFMYTVESMRQIRSALKEDGVLCLSFYVGRPWVAKKLQGMLAGGFGHPPAIYNYPAGGYGDGGHLMVIGPHAAPSRTMPGFNDIDRVYETLKPTPVPTDDWPFLYYQDRTISRDYAIALLLILGISIAGVSLAMPSRLAATRSNATFFLLGAGFLLLEVKNLNRLALAFGSTWLVTSIAVSGVLTMVLLSVWCLQNRLAPRESWTWAGLFGSIVLAACWPSGLLARPLWDGALTALVISSTFFFTNIAFARFFERTGAPGESLGFNVLGSVIGGLLEYGTLIVGFKAMYGLAVFFYAAAWWSGRRRPALSS
ncbi:MAG: hypothetical protein NTY77_02745 [Elusimicrobia bacterium]|nr:hypothetical protein [Elusimicrobiota bacterium]